MLEKNISKDDIFCRLLNTYKEYIYTDKPHGLSDKDIGILADAVMELLKAEKCGVYIGSYACGPEYCENLRPCKYHNEHGELIKTHE